MSNATLPAQCLVLALGNPLMRDDGVGWHALRQLTELTVLPDTVTAIDGGTAGMQLLPLVEAAPQLLVLDAIRAGQAPGTVVELEHEAVPRYLAVKLSPHQIDLREVLALAELRGKLPPMLAAVGIEPELVTLGEGLTPAVAAALPALLGAVRRRLEAWGHRCCDRGNAHDRTGHEEGGHAYHADGLEVRAAGPACTS